ncbi:MAG: DUF4442 domain-containing protein [Saprospiraceae bacterium]|nr:DUF4442 domain-containing protein [Saprospiraceae bacterium]
MSYYQAIANLATKYFGASKAFKYGFNWSPMYRRSNARIIAVSKDLMKIEIRLPLTYKNVNYMNSMFGGSMFAAVDPIPMIQLVSILGKEYVVWDKSAEIYFKRPAKENLFATFEFSNEEVEEIKSRVKSEKEISISKSTILTNKIGDTVYCEVKKTIYIADKMFYKQKNAQRREKI